MLTKVVTLKVERLRKLYSSSGLVRDKAGYTPVITPVLTSGYLLLFFVMLNFDFDSVGNVLFSERIKAMACLYTSAGFCFAETGYLITALRWFSDTM